MVGVDTNVLVRFFMRDDELQSKRATALVDSFSADEQGFVSFIVVAELVWVLQYVFQLRKDQVITVLAKLGSMPAFKLENLAVFLHALQLCNSSSADFVDCLISGVAMHAGCTGTMTFDRKSSKVPGMTRIR
ncbi:MULTISPECIES: PIN domain-containing protein [unclassified Duganella]|uniref:PIN domain-containing protein n=1 Tax=unclassified Duganella TaxID=2636909 RepID=UPI000E341EDA|nr:MULTISPECIES: type II toxin-antitoxin system VapC family toxin [unclassified Duganella]RFP11222.1 PIN domain-containing protein [Duganella sp. BJB475]RFP29541.1 PIN domain-containing protein [Duganella sp. BJB476]